MKASPSGVCDCSLANHRFSSTAPRYTISDPKSRSELPLMNLSRLEFCLYRVDKGILPEETGRKTCDHLLVVPVPSEAYLIELKGKKFDIGYDQLYDSLERLGRFLAPCKRVYAVLITTQRLSRQSLEFKRELRRFKVRGCQLLYLTNDPLSIPQSTPC